jgi:hypothetical protein
MGCKVKISVECQVAERDLKDPKKPIIGMKYIPQKEAKKNQKILVSAKMGEDCQAKIRINHKVIASGLNNLVVKATPPSVSFDECTKYQEVTFWATEVHHGEPALPEVEFTAIASCSDCECEDSKKESTDSATQQFTDH